ncbi:hypothetical protein MKZ38_010298 [Zalerion maritima]|uniref:Uncharacterized protein n=1 Tax=Zalerion maritima TaxID=339359 RepID=A0AAD5WV68_9PEZI|nr:hypothetical protein MKZ38_010298 [Zalerion maritima]
MSSPSTTPLTAEATSAKRTPAPANTPRRNHPYPHDPDQLHPAELSKWPPALLKDFYVVFPTKSTDPAVVGIEVFKLDRRVVVHRRWSRCRKRCSCTYDSIADRTYKRDPSERYRPGVTISRADLFRWRGDLDPEGDYRPPGDRNRGNWKRKETVDEVADVVEEGKVDGEGKPLNKYQSEGVSDDDDEEETTLTSKPGKIYELELKEGGPKVWYQIERPGVEGEEMVAFWDPHSQEEGGKVWKIYRNRDLINIPKREVNGFKRANRSGGDRKAMRCKWKLIPVGKVEKETEKKNDRGVGMHLGMVIPKIVVTTPEGDNFVPVAPPEDRPGED